ncbi:hypothetical protein BBO99_00003120 [Phytophthora kernoviae]|uniref:Chromo domain-containing protein n=2 Tax=Phytophthora kernoviae TaxID=325452 RepID=A0A3R7KAM2_9STRA|nr:hypothetical protein G195_003255 [Phytophthora kernoviae 00238/432]KAG2528919.1 hypothetical protein JM16_000964 [Phytophthora kernoviae]KAG2530205.1 hypothetical protein JM18_001045 [Phytophthora kernoviae]RLN44210.1 hypothetical protein BBI17_002985 [Phytophthora kernoviae]RLN82181.1 hypothetical protein BBO99_00003120 [Phytophthora kernoviae]
MPADIERIVDRKLIKQRVHYYVVWKGFGEENNTWESRMDLIADGYSSVIKQFEEERKNNEGSSTPRGRSPRRSTAKSPRKSKSPGRSPARSRSRRSRSRSASVSRRLPETDNEEDEKKKSKDDDNKESSSTPRRRKSPSNKENSEDANSPMKEALKRRSSRKQTTESSTQFVSRLDDQKVDPAEDEDDSLLLRSTIAALAPQVREITPVVPEAESKKITLAYEDEVESVLLSKSELKHTETAVFSSTVPSTHEHAHTAREGDAAGVVANLLEGGWFVSFLSVAAVVGSLVASQVLPRDDSEGLDSSDLWRRWLPFLTPIVALLLFFHQKDARASAKWVATGLAWRAAAELLLLIGASPLEFEMMVAGSAALANLSLLVAFVAILRNGEHEQSKATVALLMVGVLGLFLSDSWVITTENSELESRVILMSMAVLTIALSPMPTVSSEDDD